MHSIYIDYYAHEADSPTQEDLQRWAMLGLQNCKHPVEVAIVISDEEHSAELNGKFRNKPKPTNVLSFSNDEVNDGQGIYHLGDLLLCATVINKEAKEQNKLPHHHWAHLIIHGLLHLQGYDHMSEEDAELMEKQEIELLEKINIPNPYE